MGQVFEIEAFDGRRKTVFNAARPLRDNEGRTIGAVSVFQDITDIKRAENEARLAAQDREALIAIVSHDLKTPLWAIQLNAKLLHRSLDTYQADQRDYERVDHILRSVTSMNHLIVDLLDLSRIRGGKLLVEPRHQAVATLVDEAIDSVTPTLATKALQVTSRIDSGLPPVLADRQRIHQVLVNLIGNAVKFSPEGGQIVVAATRRQDEVVFSVRDMGPGIAAENLPHLFQRFWQAKDTAGKGTGLGLTIAEGIVKAHHGRIWAESRGHQGSTFSFTLPIARGAAERQAG